jgi:hypothetical protein
VDNSFNESLSFPLGIPDNLGEVRHKIVTPIAREKRNTWVSAVTLMSLRDPETGAGTMTFSRRISDIRDGLQCTHYEIRNRKEWVGKICHSYYVMFNQLTHEIVGNEIRRKAGKEINHVEQRELFGPTP